MALHAYILNPKTEIEYDGMVVIEKLRLLEAMNLTNDNLKKLHDITAESGVEVFEALGMRNLSGFIGEFFVSSLEKCSNGHLIKNPHQDGYPDLLYVQSEASKAHFKEIVTLKDGKMYPKEKALFSPYKYGGLEVKATCGATPSASVAPKPLIGEQRVDRMTSFDWKAHHRDTNHLISILWDFIEGLPTVVAVFFRDDLTEDDWGDIVQPKKDGGRTTSVSIMKTSGIKKMCEQWIAVIDDDKYVRKLAGRKWIGYPVRAV